jgi:hypothetical protein
MEAYFKRIKIFACIPVIEGSCHNCVSSWFKHQTAANKTPNLSFAVADKWPNRVMGSSEDEYAKVNWIAVGSVSPSNALLEKPNLYFSVLESLQADCFDGMVEWEWNWYAAFHPMGLIFADVNRIKVPVFIYQHLYIISIAKHNRNTIQFAIRGYEI